jgi:hypothetical protein
MRYFLQATNYSVDTGVNLCNLGCRHYTRVPIPWIGSLLYTLGVFFRWDCHPTLRLSDFPVSLPLLNSKGHSTSTERRFWDTPNSLSYFVGELSVCLSNETIGSWSPQFTRRNAKGFSKEIYLQTYWDNRHQIDQIDVKRLKIIVLKTFDLPTVHGK